MRPRIGITTYGPEGARSSFSLPRCYSDAVAAAGGMPVLLVSGSIPDEELLGSIDALIVAGGGDIGPESYGGAGHETVYSVNPVRDSFEMSLLRRALERTDLPVLGICRGMQVMNIVLGGDLEPHLPDVYGESVLHRLPPREPTQHGVRAERAGVLGEIFGGDEFPVCSWHHQALRRLGSGLAVTAHAPDGVVEGVVFDSHPFALGVQWHPEMQALDDARQLRLFAALVDRARRSP
ncbi:MAG: gamma-glutamyl-gamma-aminobutyrate hydrolase family protein [Deltaproteobacteria bacterium]|nr:gamma-glutamyl-gamma-aminobutyrate hydrolase family protein [Deltaproteobacteria bacterium]